MATDMGKPLPRFFVQDKFRFHFWFFLDSTLLIWPLGTHKFVWHAYRTPILKSLARRPNG